MIVHRHTQLDRMAADRHVFGMMGMKMDHSAGVREARPEDDL